MLIKNGDDLFVEFGSEDTKSTRGHKYQIKLPASKNAKGQLDEYIDKEVIMGIRPEDVHDEPRYLKEMPECMIKADIEVTEKMGSETFLYFNTEGISFTARVEPTSVARPGDNIDVVIDNNKIHIFDKDTEQAICH
jgi:multiple sugar transport system ATP-binding protein